MKTKLKVLVTSSILFAVMLIQPVSASYVVLTISKPVPIARMIASIEGERILPEGRDLYVSYIYKAQKAYFPDLDPIIVQAVMQCESNYIPMIHSRAGAVGLMQVIPKYHARRMDKYGLTNIWDPYTNIIVGMDFLNESYHKYGSYYSALKAYNNSDAYVRHVLSVAEQIRYGGG